MTIEDYDGYRIEPLAVDAPLVCVVTSRTVNIEQLVKQLSALRGHRGYFTESTGEPGGTDTRPAPSTPGRRCDGIGYSGD
ncbi:MAG: hypothetical protein J2P57_22840 [Acidimicrobiaceae bacterium]|nr:hypothetical protein [Acidimicrobiaceae bacterium]